MNKPKLLSPIYPNAGLEIAYQRKLEDLILQLHKSVKYWVIAAYREKVPDMALDMSPAMYLRFVMQRLGRYWTKKFDEMSFDLARYFATNAKDRAEGTLKAALKKAGFAIEFKMTAAMNNEMQATIGEQVGLIKSIASEHLSDVENLVMQSVHVGRDLGTLADELEKKYTVTRRRAALIARDQNNKATATITRIRQHELGITEAVWMHSHAGKVPRPEHVGWDGTRYDIAKGKWSEVDQCYVWPGTAINCRCVSKSVIPALDD